MKIQAINTINARQNASEIKKKYPLNVQRTNYSPDVTFKGAIPNRFNPVSYLKYVKAKTYLNATKKGLLKADSLHGFKLADFNLKKLNGIQHNIKVFEGLSMKEIAFMLDKFDTVAVKRGCSNLCAHCFASAKPQHFKPEDKTISNMSFEDFESLMKGIKKLRKRLGFNPFVQKKDSNFGMFFDSDCIEVEIKDKKGKVFDFCDLNTMLYNSTKIKEIFDTAGWNPKNLKQQQRAEKIVNYILNKEGSNNLNQINISINPFHSMNMKALEGLKAHDIERYKKFRDIYTDRMANAIFTFTPILNYPNFKFITRAVHDDLAAVEGTSISDLKILKKEILQKVKARYEKDLATDKKHIRSEIQLKSNLLIIGSKLINASPILPIGRAKALFKNYEGQQALNEIMSETLVEKFHSNLKSKDFAYRRFIDVNGNVVLNNDKTSIPTQIQLNFKNKHKETVPFAQMQEHALITKEMIESNY